jgi:hypothetical protein
VKFLSGQLNFDRIRAGHTRIAGKRIEFSDGGEVHAEDPQIWLGLLKRGWNSVQTLWHDADPQTLEEQILLAERAIMEIIQ